MANGQKPVKKTMSQEEGFGIIAEFFFSVAIDIIGLFSYFIPGVGEATDIATAPLNIAWILEMYNDLEGEDGPWGEVIAGLGGLEELAPFIDVIPSATIAWGLKWFFFKK